MFKKKKNVFENIENWRVCYVFILVVFGVDGSLLLYVISWRYKFVNCFNSNIERKFVYMRESVWMWMKWNVKMSWVGIFMFLVRDGVICCLYFIVDFF